MMPPEPSESERVFAMVPCQLMKGTVQVKDPASLSPLHLLALKAIAKEGDLKEVLQAFGVGRRVMQGVLADLFYDGLIYLSFRHGKAVPSAQVLQALESGRLEELLAMKAPKEVEMIWVQEMVSGGVMVYPFVSKFMIRPDVKTSAFNLAAKPGRLSSLKDFSVRTLARVALRALEEKVPVGGSLLDRVERISERRLLGSRTIYVPIRVLKPSEGREPIILPEIEGVPRSIADAWMAALNPDRDPLELIEKGQLPSDPIKAITQDGQAEEWERLLRRLKRIADSKPSRPDFDYTSNLLMELDELAQRIDDARRGIERVGAIGGAASAHFDALAALLPRARRLVLVGSAFLQPDNIDHLVSLFRPAAERGVQVVLLWGLADAEERARERQMLGEAEARIAELTTLGSEGQRGLWILPSCSPFHSKFIAIDGMFSIVSSLNWLSSPVDSKTWEASVLVEGGNVPIEVLSYGLERLPRDHSARPVGEDLISALRSAPRAKIESAPWTRAMEWTRIALSALQEDTSAATWATFKKAVVDALGIVTSIRRGPLAALVRDSEHRRLLTSALANARTELVVTSDRVREEGAGRVFQRLSADAIAKKVKVTVRWGRGMKEDALGEDSQKSVQRARTLKTTLGQGLDINIEPGGIHGKVILVDGSFALVSSFNFLAFGGVSGREKTLSGELGVAVSDSAFVSVIKESLTKHESQARDKSIL